MGMHAAAWPQAAASSASAPAQLGVGSTLTYLTGTAAAGAAARAARTAVTAIVLAVAFVMALGTGLFALLALGGVIAF